MNAEFLGWVTLVWEMRFENGGSHLYCDLARKFDRDKVRLRSIGAAMQILNPGEMFILRDSLPKGFWIPVTKTFHPKAKLERRNRPLGACGDIWPGQVGLYLGGFQDLNISFQG